MDDEKKIFLAEYRVLRREILERIRILYQIIRLAVILEVLLFIFLIWINSVGTNSDFFDTALLLVPVIFAGLVFAYQDNQRTLEATARYIEEQIKPKMEKLAGTEVLLWEKFFYHEKAKYQFSSAYKLFSFLIPFIIPFYLLSTLQLESCDLYLAFLDILLLVIIVVNFRYKLFRIKY